MSREQEREKQLARLPAARIAAPGYEAVGLWLLRAMPARDMAVEYRHALGEVWVACTCKRTLTAKQFEHALAVARQKLNAAYASATSVTERRELERATAALHRAEEEAAGAGLLA